MECVYTKQVISLTYSKCKEVDVLDSILHVGKSVFLMLEEKIKNPNKLPTF